MAARTSAIVGIDWRVASAGGVGASVIGRN
jgi:hypothetical protein